MQTQETKEQRKKIEEAKLARERAIQLSGALLEIHVINFSCSVCNKRADWRLVRSNASLPQGYIRDGKRSICYCNEHLTQDARDWYNAEMADAGLAQRI